MRLSRTLLQLLSSEVADARGKSGNNSCCCSDRRVTLARGGGGGVMMGGCAFLRHNRRPADGAAREGDLRGRVVLHGVQEDRDAHGEAAVDVREAVELLPVGVDEQGALAADVRREHHLHEGDDRRPHQALALEAVALPDHRQPDAEEGPRGERLPRELRDLVHEHREGRAHEEVPGEAGDRDLDAGQRGGGAGAEQGTGCGGGGGGRPVLASGEAGGGGGSQWVRSASPQ